MGPDDVKEVLKRSGLKITGEKRLKNNTGNRLDVSGGSIVNMFDSGAFNVQGKNAEQIDKLLKQHLESSLESPPSRKIFVVYGHDKQARERMELILRRWGLDPIILDQLPSEGQTIIEKLESYYQKEKIGFAQNVALAHF